MSTPNVTTNPPSGYTFYYYNNYNTSTILPPTTFPYIGYYQDIKLYNIIVINTYSTENDILYVDFNNDANQLIDSSNNPYDVSGIAGYPDNKPKSTKTFLIEPNNPQTLVVDALFPYYRIRINRQNGVDSGLINRIYKATPFTTQNNVKIVGQSGISAIVDLSGNLHTKDDDANVLLNNIYNVLKNQGTGGGGKTSTKGTFNFWSNNSISVIDGSNNISAICDLSSNPVKELTIYGTVDGKNSLVVQFSNNGINFYDSQYNYSVNRGGDFGFNITATPNYIRLRALSTTPSITSFINYA